MRVSRLAWRSFRRIEVGLQVHGMLLHAAERPAAVATRPRNRKTIAKSRLPAGATGIAASPPDPWYGPAMLTDRDSLLRKLHELRSEHRDLDTVIARLADQGGAATSSICSG